MGVGHEFTLKLQLSDLSGGEVDPDAEVEDYDSDEEVKKPMQMGSGTERDNVVSTLVYIHQSVGLAMIMLKRNTGKRSYVTPRHYLDFINQYASLSKSKREELAEKERNASEKLDQITEDQADAIRKRDASEEIGIEIEKQTVVANERRDKIDRALGEAKPALESAQAAVKGIKKKQLDQIRSYANPPKMVKLALQPVMMMMGQDAENWKAIKKVVAKKGFKDEILAFDVEKITVKLSMKIKKKFFDNPDFTYEKVNKASKACGPLQKW